jgi:HTH-type transcriptional regulator, transcriptional repressor of NAD biosynthesis genes
MKRFRTAVVIGKFYPPHRGHKHLIDTASTQAHDVTVIVCDEAGHAIPGELRAAWLREIHPHLTVRVVRSPLAYDDSAGWARSTIEWLGYVPDAAFTSEPYGDAYARHMGATHVAVDPARSAVPISATAIRTNPLQHLDDLEPCVRAHFVKRVVIIGSESSGTTTLARALAEHYRTVWVPEYGRTYSEGREYVGQPWRSDEFTHIATEQARMEDALARLAKKVLICDTDAFATTIWHERYMGTLSSAVQAIAATRTYDLYVVTDVSIPFVQDGIRDGESFRQWMQGRFIEELSRKQTPMIVVSGPHEERFAAAVRRIDEILTRPG